MRCRKYLEKRETSADGDEKRERVKACEEANAAESINESKSPVVSRKLIKIDMIIVVA